jgi:hypothetical protein
MSLHRRLVLAAPLLLAASPGGAQLKAPPSAMSSKWYAVQVEGSAFQVEMPGIPDYRPINDRSARGTPFVLHSYSLEIGGSAYVAQTALYPTDVDGSRPRVLLQAAIDTRALQLAGRKWKSVNWREIQGATAAETVGVLANGSGLRQLVLLQGQRFVSLAFLGVEATLAGPDADRFFKSLRLR